MAPKGSSIARGTREGFDDYPTKGFEFRLDRDGFVVRADNRNQLCYVCGEKIKEIKEAVNVGVTNPDGRLSRRKAAQPWVVVAPCGKFVMQHLSCTDLENFRSEITSSEDSD